jgi:predicted phosphodiesterase
MTRIALISDIHGNLPALRAVLDDLSSRRPDAVYVLGDMVNGCPWSSDVLDIILERGWPMLLGNHDDAVLQLGTPRMEARYGDRERYGTLWWTHDHLTPAHLACLAGLPLELSVRLPDKPAVRLVHGIPGNFFIGFRPNDSEERTTGHLGTAVEPVVAGGHTHFPLVRRTGRSLIVNDGSVGAPYDGNPWASYALLEGDREGWQAEVRRVAYDLAAVDRGFHESGLLAAGGVTAELFRRSVLTAQPWTSDFLWWMREQTPESLVDLWGALRMYDAQHGPGHWAFPYA